MSYEYKGSSTPTEQSSLAGAVVSEEEKLRQSKKAEMQKKYRILSFSLVGVIIVSVLVYLCTAQRCLVFGHKWQTATCTTAQFCTVCSVVDSEALGHDWQEATCTDPKTCALCSAVDGVALGHSWPTFDELAYCTICNHPNGRLVNIGNDVLASSWSDQKLELVLDNGRKSDPTILLTNSAVEKCYSLTLCLRINELTAGNVLGEWGFYIRDLSGEWHLADTFNLAGDYVEAHFEFDEPISFDAWACPCHVLGDYWSFSFSVWLQDATVFEYGG